MVKTGDVSCRAFETRVVLFGFLLNLQSEAFMQDFPGCKLRGASLMILLVTRSLSHLFGLEGKAVQITVSILTDDVLLFDSHVWLSASLIGLSPLVGAWLYSNLSLLLEFLQSNRTRGFPALGTDMLPACLSLSHSVSPVLMASSIIY